MPRLFAVSIALFALMFVAGCGSTQDVSTPTGLTVTATAPITLSWNASPGASSYVVYRGAATGISAKLLLGKGITTTTFSDATAIAGTTYYYQVTALNDNGQSSPSADVSAVGTFTLAALQNILAWDVVLNAVSYNVYRSTASDMSGKTQVATGLTTQTYTDTTVTTGKTYYYQIAAVNASSVEFVLSNILTVTY
jgi:fibronectin type 3 domain-containing protein